MVATAALVVAGASSHLSWGTLSGFGFGKFSAVCPLGYLETVLASRLLIPRLLLPFLLIALFTFVVGRIFCGWICPIPMVRGWLPRRDKSAPRASGAGGTSAQPGIFILGGALLSSAIFGFPVFCLICPIGLTFGTLFAVLRLFRFAEPTIALLLFPAIVIVELVVLRKWCLRLCPVGALLSLASRFHRSLIPTVDQHLCLSSAKGANCQLCRNACTMELDLHGGSAEIASNCTKCRACADKCPMHAISFPWSTPRQTAAVAIPDAVPTAEEDHEGLLAK
jgi:ferredoxin-type protein NapH